MKEDRPGTPTEKRPKTCWEKENEKKEFHLNPNMYLHSPSPPESLPAIKRAFLLRAFPPLSGHHLYCRSSHTKYTYLPYKVLPVILTLTVYLRIPSLLRKANSWNKQPTQWTSSMPTLLAQDPHGHLAMSIHSYQFCSRTLHAMDGGKLGAFTPFHKPGWDGLSVLQMGYSLAPITSVCLGETHKPETSTGMGLCVTNNLKKVKHTQKPLSHLNLESTRPPVLWITTETFPMLMRLWRLG